MTKEKIVQGCVVYMKASSGMIGYGNSQCISSVMGDEAISLYGHNEHYDITDIREVVSYPETLSLRTENEALKERIKELEDIIRQEGGRNFVLSSGQPGS